MTAIWLERRTERPPLTLNIAKQSKRTWGMSREIKDWRAWAKDEAERMGLERIDGPVSVTVVHLRRNRASMPDCGAPILAAKAVIDGLVEARVLKDDGPDYVAPLTFERPEVVGYHGLRVIIRPHEQFTTRDQPSTGQIRIPLLAEQDPQ